MRIAAIVVVVLLASWAIVELLPQPSREPPTFAEAEWGLGQLERAQRDGRLREDAGRRELRQAVLRAGERLDQLPCDEFLRQDFAAAAIPFLRAAMTNRDRPPVETLRVEGKVLNATRFLDGQVTIRIERAVADGLLRSDDLPPDVAWIAINPPEIEEARAALRQLNDTNCG